MGRNRKGRNVHGIFLLDKPEGISSNHAMQAVRRLFDARKAGHTGNLDPFATGMLPICLGEASKTAGFMLEASKKYRAVAELGKATTTGDTEGEVNLEKPVPTTDRAQLEAVLSSFVGPQSQIPPMYSALKHQGQPLYKLARQGKSVERKAREIRIHSLELLSFDPPFLSFEVHCSKGTYIRTLAEDLAKALNSCAHLKALHRREVEPFPESGMVQMKELERAAEEGEEMQFLLPIDSGIDHWPKVSIGLESMSRFRNGNPVACDHESGLVRVYGPENNILGIAESRSDGSIHPKRVFVFD